MESKSGGFVVLCVLWNGFGKARVAVCFYSLNISTKSRPLYIAV
jgi:hypothetical protein